MSRVRYGQGGYCGFSRSVRAVEAESDGKLPLTRAIAALAEEAGITRRAARAALLAAGPCEWHHTSSHANRTDYFDVAEIAAGLRWGADPLGEHMEEAEWVEANGAQATLIYGAGRPVDLYWHVDGAFFGEADYASEARGKSAARIERAAAFRRWEAALRRMAAGGQS